MQTDCCCCCCCS